VGVAVVLGRLKPQLTPISVKTRIKFKQSVFMLFMSSNKVLLQGARRF
jgi:hypothetical protein